MISYINSVVNTDQCYLCVSRPRRFGKTIAANMLGDRKIAECENWDEYINHFDVVRAVMTDFIKKRV